MHTVQWSDTPKGIPTKIECGVVRSIRNGSATLQFCRKGRGSGAPLLGQNATCFLFCTKVVGLHITYAILPCWQKRVESILVPSEGNAGHARDYAAR
eukprot:3667419-Ditylum_brightwellii.AAC.1